MKKAMVFLAAAALTGCEAGKVQMKQSVTGHVTEAPTAKMTGPKRRIAVVDFENKTAYGQGRLGSAAADVLMREIGKTGKFILVERDKINKMLEEQKLGQTGVIDPNTAAQMGKVLGVNAIVTGAISNFGVTTSGTDLLLTQTKKQVAKVTVDIRVVDAETGEVLYIDSGKGEATSAKGQFLGLGGRGGYDETLEGDALAAAVSQLALNIEAQVGRKPWSARVADFDGTHMYLDAGRESGVEIGARLLVFKLGREIKSPTTGKVIGRTEEKLGEAEVIEYFGDDGAKAKPLGAMPKNPTGGDLVKLAR